jgi:DNA-binding Lrp family transcriptional regulator
LKHEFLSDNKAILRLTFTDSTEHEMAEKIRKIEDVTEVLVTYGMWDLVARIETKNLGKLDKIITEIRQTPEIEQTSTLISA